ncbi:MAG: acyltransferase [Lachnospiraceae bacterium]|nr:acyltransferase [Lachnospiraceae bacterium]
MKKKDVSVQLLRCIACLIVVFLHSKPNMLIPSEEPFERIVLSCLLSDGVSIFLIITGFFYMKGEKYGVVLKKGFLRVVVPSMLLMLFCLVFSGWLNGKMSIAQSVLSFNLLDIKYIFIELLSGNVTLVTHCSHLWYVCAYICVLLWFPLIKRFDSNDKEICIQKYVLMALSFAYILLTTLSDRLEFFMLVNLKNYNVIPTTILFVLIGDEIYRNIEKIKRNWLARIGGLVVFIGFNILRAYDYYNSQVFLQKGSNVLLWSSVYGVICATGFTLFILSFEIRESFFEKVIIWIAKYTFPIYLIHFVILGTLYCYNNSIRYVLYDYFVGDSLSFSRYVLFVIVYGLIIFVMSLLIAIIIDLIKRGAKNLVNKIIVSNKAMNNE